MAGPYDHQAEERVDLDVLIGELLLEAARRRAQSSFPVDQEARLGLALDEQAPRPVGPDLAGLADGADAVAAATADAGATGRAQQGRAGPLARAAAAATAAVRAAAGAVSAPSLGAIVATALRAISARLEAIEARVARLEPLRRQPGPVLVAATVGTWRTRPADYLDPATGRVLYWAVDPGADVSALQAAGLDVYAIESGGDKYQTGPDVRAAELVEHLQSVGDSSLGAVVAVGPSVSSAAAGTLSRLAEELARTSSAVLVASEAPWWWRERLGDEQADVASHRPLGAETWLALLARVGFSVHAEYGEGGAYYLVRARRPQ